jgi:hypothetical protein
VQLAVGPPFLIPPQVVNENVLVGLMQATPVICATVLKIAKERKIRTKPAIAKINVFLAPSILFASPLDVISLMPETIINITATVPEKRSSQFIAVAIKGDIQLKVGTTTPAELVTLHAENII